MGLVLDTNVALSGLMWDGPPRRLLDLAIGNHVALFSSTVLLDELANVLRRRKFDARLASRGLTAEFLIRRYRRVTTLVHPARVGRVVPADAEDGHVVAAALGAGAEAIATGDRHLLALDPYRGIRILAPAAILEVIGYRVGTSGKRRSAGRDVEGGGRWRRGCTELHRCR